MRTLVESFKRLYEAGRLTKEQVAARVKSKVISKTEYREITGEDYDG